MIYMQTVMEVVDNSGAKIVRCVNVYGGTHKRHAEIGEKIFASVQQAAPNSKIKKGDKVIALIVRTKKEVRRKDGSTVRFDRNAVVLVDKKGEPIGTRVFGPVAREIREKKIYARIVSLAEEVV
jgi:large subunit ribosomal protein L14